MGKNFRGKGHRGPKNQGNRNEWLDISPAAKVNESFEAYYKAQGIVGEDEWTEFAETLRADLPTTFRVTGSRAHAEVINNIIKEQYIPHMQNVELDGKKYDPPSQIPWYPGELAWQLSAPKRVVRKTEPFKRFQRFLVGETEVGNLSRQEAVSMIPPLLMDVQPHHYCLDMCAAPGSKTAQIIEALNPHHTSSSGMIIANDSDYKRTHMLVHQTGRLPSKGLMVTNLDASLIPNIDLGEGKTLQFDRILADVPCSGDGTMRKNPTIWTSWVTNDGNSLHSLQLRILQRAMRLLKPGGRLVYSTCSFNPVEDEAVVAAAMNANAGHFTILDVSQQLTGLKRRRGMSTWKVATQSGRGAEIIWHDNHSSFLDTQGQRNEQSNQKSRNLVETAWPPSNAVELGLENCLRLLPHDQDTGGFFVCVLQKAMDKSEPEAHDTTIAGSTDGVNAEAGPSNGKRASSPSTVALEEFESKRVKVDGGNGVDKQVQKKPKRDLGFREDPFSYVDGQRPEVQNIVDFFKLKDAFPRNNLLVRNDYGDPTRILYMTNDIVRRIIENNDYTRLRMVAAGVRSFVRQDSQQRTENYCKWRIPSDGILEVVPYLGDGKVIHASLAELRILCQEQYPPISQFAPEVQKWMEVASPGNIIVRFLAGEGAGGHLPLSMCLPLWKAQTSVSLLIDKKEKSMLSLRTFGEDICTYGGTKKSQAEEVEEAKRTQEEQTDKLPDAGGSEAAVRVEDGEEQGMNS